MSGLTKEQKHQLIIELSKKHKITSYDFGKNTKLTDAGAYKVLTKESKNPHHSTLDLMLKYIEQKITGSKIPGHKNFVNESKEEYKSENIRSTEFNEIIEALRNIQNTLTTNHDMFANALELTLLNTEDIKDETTGLRENLTKMKNSLTSLSTTIQNSISRRNS